MNSKNRQLNISVAIEKGQAALRQARILNDSHEYDGAVSRAYYAAFHYASAVLLTRGLEALSHQGLVRMFNLHFIKTGQFPKRYSTILSHAQKAREESDYQGEIPFTEEDAVTRLREVEEFVSYLEQFLRTEGYLQ